MIEILKELVKEPESAKRYAISLLKFVLIAIVTSNIYVYFFGNYEPILIGDPNFWHNTYTFFISGKVLLVAFLFFVLKYIVYEFFTTIIYLIIYFITSKIKKNKSTFKDSNFFRGLLILSNVIKHNKEKEVIEPGRNFDYLYSFLISYEKEDIIDLFDNFKNSYLYEIFNIYSAFTIISFLVLNHNSITFNILIIIVFILILYLIFSFQYIYELVCANYDDLFFGMKNLKQIELTKKVLDENHIKIDFEFNRTFANFITLKVDNAEIGVEHFIGSKLAVEKIKESQLPENSKYVLITSKKLPIVLENKFKENSKLIIIEFKNNEEEFVQKLEEVLFK